MIADGVFPAELLEDSVNFRPECRGVHPPFGVWAHISGSDIVRDVDGTVYVLEDNLRVPSGVSYMIENRLIAKRAFADVFEKHSVRPVDGYTDELLALLTSLSPSGDRQRNGRGADARHLQLGVLRARLPGAADGRRRSSKGRDLVVDDDNTVYMRTIDGPKRVDVIYRRIDDMFLDPEAFHPDSTLGVAGLMRSLASRQGRDRQRARRRRRRRQGRLRVGARSDPLLPRRGAAARKRADVPVHVPGRVRLRASSTWPSSS